MAAESSDTLMSHICTGLGRYYDFMKTPYDAKFTNFAEESV